MIQLQFRLEARGHSDVHVSLDALERDTVTDAERMMAHYIRRLFVSMSKRGKRSENHWAVMVELRPESDEEE